MLIQFGADINAQVSSHWHSSPMLCPSQPSNLFMQDSKSGKTALHYAVESKEPVALVQLILSLVKNPENYVNQMTYNSQTCLHLAVGHPQIEAVEQVKLVNLLMQNKANPTLKNSSKLYPKDLTSNPNVCTLLLSKDGCILLLTMYFRVPDYPVITRGIQAMSIHLWLWWWDWWLSCWQESWTMNCWFLLFVLCIYGVNNLAHE